MIQWTWYWFRRHTYVICIYTQKRVFWMVVLFLIFWGPCIWTVAHNDYTSCHSDQRCASALFPLYPANTLSFIFWIVAIVTGFPGGSDSKESACNVGYSGSIPGSGRSAGAGNGCPLHYSWWRIPWRERSLVGYSPRGHRVRHDCLTHLHTQSNRHEVIPHCGFGLHFLDDLLVICMSVQNLHLFLNNQMVLLFICKTSLNILDQIDGFQIIFSRQ